MTFIRRMIALLLLLLAAPAILTAAENLHLNPNLNYHRNNHQGPLLTGDNMLEGAKPGMVNYVIFYSEFCYNAKRMAKRTVDLYNQYHNQVHFVVIDFEAGWSDDQNKLVRQYFQKDIPQITILDKSGHAIFNYTGETPKWVLAGWLNTALRRRSPNEMLHAGAAKRSRAAGN